MIETINDSLSPRLRDRLLHKLLSGEIRVKDVEMSAEAAI